MVKHRHDIDGLRALAVIPVILFHLDLFKIAPGGFVGVDVFFVISGFLITRIINDDIKAGSYNIFDFYNRRIRRIFPALFAVYAFCLIGSFFLLFPSEMHAVKDSLISSALFVSNIFFYLSSDYFDIKIQTNPLLHTWSLSVEEQFYIFFPVIVYAAKRFGGQFRAKGLISISLLSLLYSIFVITSDKSAAFYLVQHRAWELLLGSLIAIGSLPQIKSRTTGEIAGFIGLLAILLPVYLYQTSTPFPGVAALPPCLGAALIIYSGMNVQTTVSRALSILPMRFIGLISYSLYLWHWPIIVFSKFILEPAGAFEKSILFGICLIAAVLSWLFIETPFRQKPFGLTPKKTILAGCCCMVAVCILSAGLLPLSSAYWKQAPAVDEMLGYIDYDTTTPMRKGTCFLTSKNDHYSFFQKKTCLKTVENEKNYLLLGDSHAAHLWPGLSNVAQNTNLLQANASGCKPTLPLSGEQRCTRLMDFVFNDFLKEGNIDTIILAARWKPEDLESIIYTVSQLKPYAQRVVVMGPIVEYSMALPRLIARSIYRQNLDLVSKSQRSQQKETDHLFSEQLKREGIEYISMYKTLCTETCIILTPDNIPVQFDYGHLTAAGSRLVARKIRDQLFSPPP